MEKTFENTIMRYNTRNRPEDDFFYQDKTRIGGAKYKVVKDGLTTTVVEISTETVVYTFKPGRRVIGYNFFCINETPYFVVNYSEFHRDMEFERESINLITKVMYNKPHATVIFLNPIRNIGENVEFDSAWFFDNMRQKFTVKVGNDSNFEIVDWGEYIGDE